MSYANYPKKAVRRLSELLAVRNDARLAAMKAESDVDEFLTACAIVVRESMDKPVKLDGLPHGVMEVHRALKAIYDYPTHRAD